MADLLSVADALARVLADAKPLPAEQAALTDAHCRVLADDVAALRTQPPQDLSAMDGYAVRAASVVTVPATLKVIGEVAAGHPFGGSVGGGEAARIFTGGVVPPGADTIVIQENTTRDGDTVVVTSGSPAGKHIRRAGLDFKQGAVLLAKGRRLTDRDLMLAAAMNNPTLPVHRRPRVAVFGTGDELVPPGATPGPGEIVYSNGFALMALARSAGAEVIDLGIVPDKVDATVAAIRKAREAKADVLLTSGGASVGDHDLVQKGLAAEGLALSFWRIALRPGRPMMHGRLGGMQVLGVPGNPVSAFVCAVLFLVPLIRRLSGCADVEPRSESAKIGLDLPANDERADYMRATLSAGSDGTLVATPIPVQDSSMMAALANADCLVIREPFAPAVKAGSDCAILRLTPAF
ncbi:MAG: gephyrin-like molybdotransferase Glp [Xanthobacteraceae bacterium]